MQPSLVKLAVVSVSVLVTSVAAAGPQIAKVSSVTVGACSTDGGKAKCSTGVKYLGELVQTWFNRELQDHPLACAAQVQITSAKFKMGYAYNDGQVMVFDDDKVKAKWPACVQDFTKQASGKLLEWWKVLQPIDPTIDINSMYTVTIAIKK